MYKKTKLSKYLNISVNAVVLVISYFYIVWTFNQKSIDFVLPSCAFSHLSIDSIIIIGFFISVLTFVNWSIEAIKWKLLINPIHKISFYRALKSILVGLFTSLFMPNRSGEWIGRIFSISNEHKGALLVQTLVGNFIQYFITLLFGLIAIIYFFDFNYQLFLNFDFNYAYITYSFIAVLIIFATILLLFFFNKRSRNWIISLIKRVKNSFKYLKTISIQKLNKLLFLSLFRYCVFTLQYLILFFAFNLPINILDLIMLISLYYFILSIIPTVLFSEIGVRGSISLMIFNAYCEKYGISFPNLSQIIIFVSLLIWIFNIIIPSIIGSFYMYKFKLIGKWFI